MEEEPNHNQIIKCRVVILTSFTEDCSLDDDSMVLATAVAVDCSDAEEVKALVDDDDDEEVCCVLCATLSVTVCKSMEQQPQRLSKNRHT